MQERSPAGRRAGSPTPDRRQSAASDNPDDAPALGKDPRPARARPSARCASTATARAARAAEGGEIVVASEPRRVTTSACERRRFGWRSTLVIRPAARPTVRRVLGWVVRTGQRFDTAGSPEVAPTAITRRRTPLTDAPIADRRSVITRSHDTARDLCWRRVPHPAGAAIRVGTTARREPPSPQRRAEVRGDGARRDRGPATASRCPGAQSPDHRRG